MGNVVNAVDRYSDIPAATRAVLKRRMAARQYDEIAAIRRDSITGKHAYAPELRQMHFGAGQVCGTVTRSNWKDNAVERGLVYCEDGHCLIVPTVCRNVSRVTRLEQAPETQAAPPRSLNDEGPKTAAQPTTELPFDAPGAGSSFAEQAGVDAVNTGGGLVALGGEGGAGVPSAGGFPITGGGVGGVVPGSSTPAGNQTTVPAAITAPVPATALPESPTPLPPTISSAGPPFPIDILPPGGSGGIGVLPGITSAVPESGTLLLTALGLAALAPLVAAQRRRRAGREPRRAAPTA